MVRWERRGGGERGGGGGGGGGRGGGIQAGEMGTGRRVQLMLSREIGCCVFLGTWFRTAAHSAGQRHCRCRRRTRLLTRLHLRCGPGWSRLLVNGRLYVYLYSSKGRMNSKRKIQTSRSPRWKSLSPLKVPIRARHNSTEIMATSRTRIMTLAWKTFWNFLSRNLRVKFSLSLSDHNQTTYEYKKCCGYTNKHSSIFLLIKKEL